MAQDKKVFIGGMDKDSDPRLIKNGDYRDALNIRNMSSVDSTSGSVENIEGNTLVPFSFIDETDEIIEFSSSSDGHIVIEEIPIEQVFRSQTILFSGKEDLNNSYNINISYLSVTESSDGSFIDSGNLPVVGIGGASGISWQGNESNTGTSQAFLQKFAEGGSLNKITVQDYITGNSLLLEVDSITTNNNQDINPSTPFNSGSPFIVTYIAVTANTNFLLNFTSNNSQVTGESWSQTVNNDFENGSLWISNDINGANNSITVGSIFDFGVLDDIYNNPNYNIDPNNEDVTYSSGLNEGTSGATVDLIISGEEPSSNSTSVVNNVSVFGYNQISGDGTSVDDYDITEVINIADNIDSFANNGAFEFGDQQQISSFILDSLKTPSQGGNLGPVPVKGGAGIITNFAGVSTNFTSATKLKGFNSSDTRSLDDLTYNLLEYYYDDSEVVEQSGFSIDKGTLTFEGDDILAGELYLLKSPIISDVSYKLSGTVAGLPSGNSFTFNIFNNQSVGAIANGAFSSFITPSANSVYVSIKFANNFSASDKMTITNLRLLLEQTEVSQLRVRFQTSTSLDFNLAFATSEENLREKLSSGEIVDQVTEWFPGIGMDLVKLNSGNDEVDIINSFEYTDLQSDLASATLNLNNLHNQLATQEADHAAELEILTAQASTDSAAALSSATTAANTANALQEENQSLTAAINALEDIIIKVNDPDSEEDVVSLISAYNTNKEGVSSALNNILSNLSSLDASLVVNAELETEIIRLENVLSENLLEIENLNQEITDKNSTIIELTTINTALNNEATIVVNTLSSIDKEITKLTSEEVIAQSQINHLNSVNESLSDIISSNAEVTGGHQETIEGLTSDLADANVLIQNAALDTKEDAITITDQQGQVLSLNDLINKLNDDVLNLESELLDETSTNKANENTITELRDELDKLQSNLNESQTLLNNLEIESDNLGIDYALLELNFNSLTDQFNAQATLNSELELFYEDDLGGIFTQENVDQAFVAGSDSVEVINIINEYQDINDTPKLTEFILENNFEGNITKWIGNNWNFFNGFTVADKKLYGNPGVLRQSFTTPVPANNYVLSLDVFNIDNCSLEIRFINESGKSTFIDFYEVNSKGVSTFSVNLPQTSSGISISLNSQSKGSVSLNNISLVSAENDGSVTPNLIMELLASVNQVNVKNKNLQNAIESQKEIIINLEEDSVLAKQQITKYTQALNNSNTNVANLSNVITDVLSDLNVSSNLTPDDVTAFNNTFNGNQGNIQEQINNQTSLVNNVIDLLNTVEGSSVPSPGTPLNEKWLFTFSGGVPVKEGYNDLPPSVGLFMRNSGISDLGYDDDGNNFYVASLGNFGSIMNVINTQSTIVMSREHSIDDLFGYITNSHPEESQLSFLNTLTGKTDFDNNLIDKASGEFYNSVPHSFYYTFYSSQTDKNYTVKITALNIQPRKSLVDTNGDSYEGGSTGDRIIGDRGEQRPLHTSTAYLQGLNVSDGLQYEVEFLNQEAGFEFYLCFNTGSLKPLTSQSETTIYSDQSSDYSWNVSNVGSPGYEAEEGINLKAYSEKIQEVTSEQSNQSTSLQNSPENFVNSLSSPSYNGDNVISGNYSYPAGNADIIRNKSQDKKEELSRNLLGAKRFVKNKI